MKQKANDAMTTARIPSCRVHGLGGIRLRQRASPQMAARLVRSANRGERRIPNESKHPQHSAILTEVIDTIERRMTIPLAVVVPFLGLGLIYTGHFSLWKSEWLVISIVLYIVAFSFAIFVQNRNSAALVRALRDIPPGPPPPGATGPPPQIAALVNKTRIGGIFLTVLVVAIAILMVWRPGNCQGPC